MPPEEKKKTFTQEDLDRVVDDRLKRERGKYSDYEDLKKAAEELADLKAKDQTELDREKAARAAAEKERDDAKTSALRFEIAAEKGVKSKYISGSTREELEAAADEYLKDHPNAGAAGAGGGGGGGGGGGKSTTAVTKPAENLGGGGDPTTEAETTVLDPAELAKSVPRL